MGVNSPRQHNDRALLPFFVLHFLLCGVKQSVCVNANGSPFSTTPLPGASVFLLMCRRRFLNSLPICSFHHSCVSMLMRLIKAPTLIKDPFIFFSLGPWKRTIALKRSIWSEHMSSIYSLINLDFHITVILTHYGFLEVFDTAPLGISCMYI